MPARLTAAQFLAHLEEGAYAWPGGYPKYFLCADGEPLSFKAAEANKVAIVEAIEANDRSDWRVIACEINWETKDLRCADTNEVIECAYDNDDD